MITLKEYYKAVFEGWRKQSKTEVVNQKISVLKKNSGGSIEN